MQPCMPSVFEVGGGGVACMSTLRHSYRDAVILENIKSLSFDGYPEKKNGVYIFGKQV